jgi:hypothetical protein
MKRLLLIVTHLFCAGAGFALGIYLLPILTAPASPAAQALEAVAAKARYTATFRRDLKDSDALHWGEGEVSIAERTIALRGRLAPGPDYRLYLAPEFVETEADFNRLKSMMVQVAPVRTFDNFMVDIPPGIDIDRFTAVIIWCEAFGQFITAARYR